MCTPDGGGDDGSRIATAIRTGSTGMLLLLLLLTLHPAPTSGTVYVHTADGHTAGTAAPYPSEPARFGRVFDGVVTGPGNLFLPPRGVDSRLCSVTVDVDDGDEGVGARAADGAGGAVDVSTVATDATLSLTDITTMEVGATVTGATSGTTGVITALGTNAITVDNVSGFFKSGEVVSANDVTTLTITSFS